MEPWQKKNKTGQIGTWLWMGGLEWNGKNEIRRGIDS